MFLELRGAAGQRVARRGQPGSQEPRGAGQSAAQVTAELRDQTQPGTAGEILADHQPTEQLWINKDFGIQTGRGRRQPPVRNLREAKLESGTGPRHMEFPLPSGCEFSGLKGSDSCVCQRQVLGREAGVSSLHSLHGSKATYSFVKGGCVVQ